MPEAEIGAGELQNLGLSQRAKGGLLCGGYRTVNQVEEAKDAELLRIPNFGRVSLWEVRAAIKQLRARHVAYAGTEELTMPTEEEIEAGTRVCVNSDCVRAVLDAAEKVRKKALNYTSVRVVDEQTAYELVGVSSRTWDRMRANGETPPYTKISDRRIGYRLVDLEQWLDARRVYPKGTAR